MGWTSPLPTLLGPSMCARWVGCTATPFEETQGESSVVVPRSIKRVGEPAQRLLNSHRRTASSDRDAGDGTRGPCSGNTSDVVGPSDHGPSGRRQTGRLTHRRAPHAVDQQHASCRRKTRLESQRVLDRRAGRAPVPTHLASRADATPTDRNISRPGPAARPRDADLGERAAVAGRHLRRHSRARRIRQANRVAGPPRTTDGDQVLVPLS